MGSYYHRIVAAAANANVPVIITTNIATIIVWIVFFIV